MSFKSKDQIPLRHYVGAFMFAAPIIAMFVILTINDLFTTLMLIGILTLIVAWFISAAYLLR